MRRNALHMRVYVVHVDVSEIRPQTGLLFIPL
jgi:hypothetical protein